MAKKGKGPKEKRQKIQKMWPDAIRIEHPNRGDWIVTTKEKD